jgi:hypothetical protein
LVAEVSSFLNRKILLVIRIIQVVAGSVLRRIFFTLDLTEELNDALIFLKIVNWVFEFAVLAILDNWQVQFLIADISVVDLRVLRVPSVAEGLVQDISSSLVALPKLRWLPVIESFFRITDSLTLNKVSIIALNLSIDCSPIDSRILNITKLFPFRHSLRAIAL